MSVGIHVRYRQLREVVQRVANFGLERAVSDAEQDRNIGGTGVDDHQVGLAVLVEIARVYSPGGGSHRTDSARGKGRVPVSRQDEDRWGDRAQDGNVDVRVVVEQTRRDRPRTGNQGNRKHWCKRAVAVAQQNRGIVAVAVRHDDVGIRVVVEVRNRDAGYAGARCRRPRVGEAACPVREHDGDRHCSVIPHPNDVLKTVLVQVPERRAPRAERVFRLDRGRVGTGESVPVAR